MAAAQPCYTLTSTDSTWIVRQDVEGSLRGLVQRLLGMMLLVVGVSGGATANAPSVPEIGMGSAGSAIALVSGSLLVMRARRRK